MKIITNKIRKFKFKLFQNHFFVGVTTLISGTAIGQILSFLMIPIITRLFTASDYGYFSSFISIIAIFSISSTLDYHKAIPIAKDNDEVKSIVSLSLGILSFFSIIFWIVLYFWGTEILFLFDNYILIRFQQFLPIAFFLYGLDGINNELFTRNKKFKLISFFYIFSVFLINFLKIIFGFFSFGVIGLLLGLLIGQITTIIIQFKFVNNFYKFYDLFKFKSLLKTLIIYKNFAIFSSPSNYLNMLSNQLPIIIMVFIYGPYIGGLFALSNTIIKLPISLIGQSVARVFFSEACLIGKGKPQIIKRLVISLMIKLGTLSIIPFTLLILFGPSMFYFVFGSDWEISGVFSSILSISMIFNFVVMPVGRLLEIFDKQKTGLIFNILRFVLVSLTFFLAFQLNFSYYLTILIYSLSLSFTYISLVFLVFQVLNYEIKKLS